MRKILMAVTVCVVLPVNISHAVVQKAPIKVNKIVKTCLVEKSDVADAACESFVGGVNEATKLYANMELLKPSFCIPKEVNLSQMAGVYRAHIKERDIGGRFPAALSVVSAFKQAYPCPEP